MLQQTLHPFEPVLSQLDNAKQTEDLMITTQPFTSSDAEYDTLVAIELANYPENLTSAQAIRHFDINRQKQYLLERTWVLQDGDTVGAYSIMEPYWAYEPGKYNLQINLLPEADSQDLRSAVWNQMLNQLADRQPTKLISGAREDKQNHIDFLRARGFEPAMRFEESMLTLSEFDAGRFADTVDQVAASGLAIVPLSDLMNSEPDWQRKIYELDCALTADIPYPDPIEPEPFETFVRKVLGSPGFLPQGSFFALDNDALVGLSVLLTNAATPHVLQTGLTGVLRSHRRRGLATALKVTALQFAQAYGAAIVKTENEENNPMYQINLSLGFKPLPAWIEYRLSLENSAQLQHLLALPVTV